MGDAFECPSCAMNVDGRRRDYRECPYCGYEFPHQKRNYTLIAVLLLLLMVIFAFYLI